MDTDAEAEAAIQGLNDHDTRAAALVSEPSLESPDQRFRRWQR